MSYVRKVVNRKGFLVTPHLGRNYWKAVDLRHDILREPLGLRFTREQLLAEDKDIHVVYRFDNVVWACLVLTPLDDKRIKMRQVAVDDDLQGKGIGSKLLEWSEALAKDKGYQWMECNARKGAVPFYLKHGYQTVGDEFVEVGIPHYHMQKQLLP